MDTDRVPWFRGRWVEQCPEPVFIIGSPRSGTTALGKSLGAHPSMWVSNETKFMAALVGDHQLERVVADEIERPTASWLRTNGVDRAEFIAAVGIGINALVSSRSDGRRWVDHTPHYTPIAELLATMFPGASFVHIVRDGRAVVHSMLHFADRYPDAEREAMRVALPRYTRDFDAACTTWVEMVAWAEALSRSLPDRCLTVRNEDLEADPVRGLGEVSDFLGLDRDPVVTATWTGNRFNSSFDPRSGPRAPRPAPDSSWTDQERARFEGIAAATMRRHGYQD